MKLKTHKGTKKRVKLSSKGKIMFNKAAHRHLLVNKSKRQKQLAFGGHAGHHSDETKIKQLLGLK